MLRINDVVVFGEARYRILDVSDIRYTWINIDFDKAFPERVSLAEVEDFILSETLKKLMILILILPLNSRHTAQ